MSERGFFGAAENTLLIVSYCEEQGWLRVSDEGQTGATEAGIAWLDELDRAEGYSLEWHGEGEITTNRILVRAARVLAEAAPNFWEWDDAIFHEALDKLVPANAVRYDSGMEEVK